MSDPSARNRKLVWLAVGLLFVLHHDFWFWSSRTLLLGFLPVGLAYHLLFSLAAGGVWFAMVKFAWPGEIEDFANGKDRAPGEPAEKQP